MSEKITDLELYNTQMSYSINDKLFFLNHIKIDEVDTIVDFGCANGELFKYCPVEWKKIGIDNNLDMIKSARANFSAAFYTTELDKLGAYDCSKAILNMSSVIHEIYSYLNYEDIRQFWYEVFHRNFKYIVIRDMMVSDNTNVHWDEDDVSKVLSNPKGRLFDDFRKHFAECRRRDLIHFLMKYRYTENWARERAENYYPITVEELFNLIPDTYEYVYYRPYILEWTRDKVKEDFGIQLTDPTHIKLILKRI